MYGMELYTHRAESRTKKFRPTWKSLDSYRVVEFDIKTSKTGSSNTFDLLGKKDNRLRQQKIIKSQKMTTRN